MAIRKKGLGKGLDGMFPAYSGGLREEEFGKEKEEKKTRTQKAQKNIEKETTETGKEETESLLRKKEAGHLKKDQDEQEKKEETREEQTEIHLAEELPKKKDHTVILKLSEVEPNRSQPRKTFNEDTLLELAESIRQYGVIQPLIVQKRDGYYGIIAGERRWRAAKMAGLKEVPVIIKEYTDQEIMEISLIENIQREDLNPIEEAQAYQRLLDEFHMKQDELAEKVVKSRTTITNSLRLLKLDERVKQMLIEEMLTTGHARALLALADGDQQYEAAQTIFEKGLSVREVEKLVKRLLPSQGEKKEAESSKEEALDLIFREMEEKMKDIFGTKVTVNRRTEKKGRIEIEYYSNEELERIYDLMRGITR